MPSVNAQPQTPVASAEPLTDSQTAGITAVTQALQPSNDSNRRSETTVGDIDTTQSAVTASPYMLPIELLAEIFLHLHTPEVVRVAQVCKLWCAASTDLRLWRHLSFGKARPGWAECAQLRTIGARCGNTVESVEFVNLSSGWVVTLVKDLMASAQSLKHIHWSSPPSDNPESLLAVRNLATACPKLEALELSTIGCFDMKKLSVHANSVKPRCISISSSSFKSLVRFDKSALWDHATTLEFKTSRLPGQYNLPEGPDVSTLKQLLGNPALEKLTLHGLHAGGFNGIYKLSAPSLTRMDLRWSSGSSNDLEELDAPSLRELAIDAHLLSRLTPASTGALSSLTIRLACREECQSELDGLDRVQDYQGSLNLTVDRFYTADVLRLLARGTLWPGLAAIEIELYVGKVKLLIATIAARHAGALGASSSQYVEILSNAYARLSTLQDGSTYLHRVQDVLAAASAFEADASTPPLCKQIKWKIYSRHSLVESVRSWLNEQPNIEVKTAPYLPL